MYPFFPPSPVVVNGILDFKRGRRKGTIYYVPAEMDKEAREKKDRRKTERKREDTGCQRVFLFP